MTDTYELEVEVSAPRDRTWTALTDPHGRPLGSVPQLRTVSNGFGRLLIGVTLACSDGPDAPRGGTAGCAGAGACALASTIVITIADTTARPCRDCTMCS